MGNRMALYRWLDTVVSGIRFGPDRAAVRAELQAHIEDKTDDLRRVFPHISPEEARERALAGMGDPEELKLALARVHRPWLGYLWMASRWLVRGVLAVGLALILLAVVDGLSEGRYWSVLEGYQGNREARAVSQALYGGGTPDWEGERLAVYDVDAEARLGRAVVSVSQAARWREPEGDCLYLQVRITWDRPWETCRMTAGFLWAEDNQGRRYAWDEAGSIHARGTGARGLFYCQENLCLKGVPPEVKQLRLHYIDGTGLDLVLDLNREVTP